MRRLSRFWFVVTSFTCLGLVPAHAGMIPSGVAVAPNGPNHTFSYSVILPSDYKVMDGDFFTIYDFSGFVGGTNGQPVGWTFSSSQFGPNPPHIAPGETAEWNLTWTYHGPDITVSGSLGMFSAGSAFGPATMEIAFASQDRRAADDRPVGNYTTTLGPDPSAMLETPEPATLAMLVLGVPCAGMVHLVRRRRAV